MFFCTSQINDVSMNDVTSQHKLHFITFYLYFDHPLSLRVGRAFFPQAATGGELHWMLCDSRRKNIGQKIHLLDNAGASSHPPARFHGGKLLARADSPVSLASPASLHHPSTLPLNRANTSDGGHWYHRCHLITGSSAMASWQSTLLYLSERCGRSSLRKG